MQDIFTKSYNFLIVICKSMTGSELKSLIKEKNLTHDKAADLLDMTRQTLSVWIKAGVPSSKVAHVRAVLGSIPFDTKNSIFDQREKHPKKNSVFPLDVLTNSGKRMATFDSHSGLNTQIKQVAFEDFEQVPLLTIQAQAGYLDAIEMNAEPKLDVMLIPKEFEKGNYLVIEISGDSMNDQTARSIQDGDKLLCKELQQIHWKNKLHFKQYLFVIVSNEGIVCKQVTNHNVEEGKITCHSWNELYQDYEVNLSDVYKLFYVKKIVERRIKF